MIDRTYHGLSLFPLVLLQHRRISNGLDRAVLKKATALCIDRPDCVNEVNWLHLENLLEHLLLFSDFSQDFVPQVLVSLCSVLFLWFI